MDYAQFQVCFPGASEAIEELRTQLKDASASKTEEETKSKEEWAQKFTELETANGELKTQLEEKQKVIEDLESRLKYIEDDVDVKTMKEKVAKNEEELPKVLESVVAFQKEMGEYQERMADALQKANVTTQKTEEYGDSLRQFDIKWKNMSESHEEYGKKIAAFEAELAAISKTQKEVQEMVTDKYDTLWAEVTKALGNINTQHVEEVQRDLEQRNDQMKTEAKNLVSYALEIMAKVSSERKRNIQRKNLLLAWKNQSWVTQRQRLGFLSLQRQIQRRLRDSFTRWKINDSMQSLLTGLREEYGGKIPDVEQIVNATGIPKRIDDLQQLTAQLQENIAALEGNDKALETTHASFDEKLGSLEDIMSRLSEYDKDFLDIAEKHDAANDRIESVAVEASTFSDKIHAVEEQLRTEVAHTNEVQGMMKDVLLIWNSIKQLDAAKADKKEVDAVALESSNREKIQMRDMEEIKRRTSVEYQPPPRADGGNVEEITKQYEELVSRVDENSAQFKTLQSMLASLASFVEELVGKIAENQGIDSSRLTTVRTGGGYRREKEQSYSWPEKAPRALEAGKGRFVPEDRGNNGFYEDMDRGEPGDYQEGMERWLKYAKGIVEATIDSAVSQDRRRPRPRTAQGRLPPGDERDDAGVGVSGTRIPGISPGARPGNWRQGILQQGPIRKGPPSSRTLTRH